MKTLIFAENSGMIEILSSDVTNIEIIPGALKLSKKRCSSGSVPIFKKKRSDE